MVIDHTIPLQIGLTILCYFNEDNLEMLAIRLWRRVENNAKLFSKLILGQPDKFTIAFFLKFIEFWIKIWTFYNDKKIQNIKDAF